MSTHFLFSGTRGCSRIFLIGSGVKMSHLRHGKSIQHIIPNILSIQQGINWKCFWQASGTWLSTQGVLLLVGFKNPTKFYALEHYPCQWTVKNMIIILRITGSFAIYLHKSKKRPHCLYMQPNRNQDVDFDTLHIPQLQLFICIFIMFISI